MNIEEFRAYCIAKPRTSEELPFGDDTLAFKVAGKIFAITGLDSFEGINLKCDPEYAIKLREEYPEISPGYHMNKKHWNTVSVRGGLSDRFIKELTDHSFDLVVQGLPSKIRNEILT
ncbi:MAG TPA: MmcQ-like protein [Flavobacteriales bacterium]|jgi:predicted DNA-binding protein (MmcQ/YjbR family)|nr:MmcQ-like protein [Flavobacteriales bacterium]